MKEKKFEVIDCHVHTFPDDIAKGAIAKLAKISGLTPCTNGTVDDTIKKMKKWGIDTAVLLNIATAPNQQASINYNAKVINENYNGKVIAFGSVHFEAESPILELERIKSLGIKGIKLHPDYQGFMIDDKRLFPIYDYCAQNDLPIVFHAGCDCYSPSLVHAPPALSSKVIKEFPKLKMVLAHFGGLQMWDEVEEHIIGKNVWLDTAMCATYCETTVFERLAMRHDSDKILFGSDCPWENPADTFEFVDNTLLSDDFKEKIFSKNAKSLLKL